MAKQQQQALSKENFLLHIAPAPSPHSRDWSGRSDTGVNVPRVFQRCQGHKAKLGVLPSVELSPGSAPGQGGHPNTQTQLLCSGTAWGLSQRSASTFSTPGIFPSTPGCRMTPNSSRPARPALSVPELRSARLGAAAVPGQPCRALPGEHSALLSTICRCHMQPPPPEAPLPRTAAPLPHQLLILLPSLSIFCYSYSAAAMSEPDMAFHGGWGW